MSDQSFGFNELPRSPATNLVPDAKYRVTQFAYLSAIALATTGWMWLIVWVVMQSI